MSPWSTLLGEYLQTVAISEIYPSKACRKKSQTVKLRPTMNLKSKEATRSSLRMRRSISSRKEQNCWVTSGKHSFSLTIPSNSFARQAENEARLGLDFVSLLLSKDTPKQASTSMSPFLSKHVPPGTLAFDIWANVEKMEPMDEEKALSKGWSSKSLHSAAGILQQASVRLHEEVGKETLYWHQVLSVKEAGWPIVRAIRGRHLLGVNFGMAEGKSVSN